MKRIHLLIILHCHPNFIFIVLEINSFMFVSYYFKQILNQISFQNLFVILIFSFNDFLNKLCTLLYDKYQFLIKSACEKSLPA